MTIKFSLQKCINYELGFRQQKLILDLLCQSSDVKNTDQMTEHPVEIMVTRVGNEIVLFSEHTILLSASSNRIISGDVKTFLEKVNWCQQLKVTP